MDRSYLSDQKVIAASRDLVCMRLATYESKEEAETLKSIFTGRSGELENTTFALLTPRGERVGRAGRSPDFAFDGPAGMADAMRRLAAQNPGKKDERRELPIMKNLRLALDVASCDGLPLAVVLGQDKDELERLEARVASVASSEALAGRFIYASVADPKELAPIAGVTRKSGILVVAPDVYGQKGTVLVELDPTSDAKALAEGLERGRAKHAPAEKDPRAHIREGHRLGVHWDTEIPDTDPGPGPGGPRRGR